MLDRLAAAVTARGLHWVTALAVESTRPVHNLSGQAVTFLTPVLGALFSREEIEKYAALLENPKAADYFLEKLDAGNSPGGKS